MNPFLRYLADKNSARTQTDRQTDRLSDTRRWPQDLAAYGAQVITQKPVLCLCTSFKWFQLTFGDVALYREGFRRRATCGRSASLCGRWWRRRRAGRTTGSATSSWSARCVAGTPSTCPETTHRHRRQQRSVVVPSMTPARLPPTARESCTTWCISAGAATITSGRRSPTSAYSWPSRAPGSARRRRRRRLTDAAWRRNGVDHWSPGIRRRGPTENAGLENDGPEKNFNKPNQRTGAWKCSPASPVSWLRPILKFEWF